MASISPNLPRPPSGKVSSTVPPVVTPRSQPPVSFRDELRRTERGEVARQTPAPSGPGASSANLWKGVGEITEVATDRQLRGQYWKALRRVLAHGNSPGIAGATLKGERPWLKPLAQAIDNSAKTRREIGTRLLGADHPHAFSDLKHQIVQAYASTEHPTLAVHPADVVVLPLKFKKNDEQEVGLTTLALFRDKASGQPAAWAMCTYVLKDDGTKVLKREYLMRNPTDERSRGLAQRVHDIDSKLVRQIGVSESVLEGWWAGRFVWPSKWGYDFKDDSVRDELKGRLQKLLSHFEIDPSTLYFQREDGTREPFSLDALRTAKDLTQVAGATVHLPLQLGEGVHSAEQAVPVGKALLLGDPYDPKLGQNGADLFPEFVNYKRAEPA